MKREWPGRCVTAFLLMLQTAICAQLFVLFCLRPEFEGALLRLDRLCVKGQDGQAESSPISSSRALCHRVAFFCFYAPLALVLFAMLGYLFGACLPDVGPLRFSLVLQTLATAVMLISVTITIVGNWHLARRPGFAAVFILSVFTCVEMGVAAILCWYSTRRLTRRKDLTAV